MSEKENPEVIADEELDAVAGGGCCGEQVDCVRHFSGDVVHVMLCDGCEYFKNGDVDELPNRCDRPYK
jgi:hypothetical protein